MIRTAVTENGIVRGIEAADPRITSFKGIPFAAPPVGQNRWRAPQPCPKWEGTLEAYRFAPISVQDTPALGDDIYCREWHVDPDIAMDEDCLYLNVWTSAKSVKEKQAVLVWFFGGALQWGYPAEMEFDGERIARRGIVVVTVNYRLNTFGFMAHPEITKEQADAPANFGNLDQQAGLKWVIRNIHAFGGDPKNITIAGQSAGGASVMSQMTCPDNFGLFQKAVVHSGIINNPYADESGLSPKPLSHAEKNGVRFFDFMGVANLEEARKLDAIYIRDKYAEFVKINERMGMVIDNKFCINDPVLLYMKNKHAMVPLMSGNTTDEFLNYISANSDEEFIEKVKEIFGENANEFLENDEVWKKDGNNYASISGIECTIKSLFLQNQEYGNSNNYYYRFDVDIPGGDDPGKFHSVDLWFFFETLAKSWRPFTGKHYDVARVMCNYYCNFIKYADPNGLDSDGASMPDWNTYTKENPSSMVFSTDGAYAEKEETHFKDFLIERISEKGV
ncbi:MAG TPA: carboxylesterase family protein [Clostridiales bacterium]|nr:carboxylesterase family protein [Clostridiales bacterium]